MTKFDVQRYKLNMIEFNYRIDFILLSRTYTMFRSNLTYNVFGKKCLNIKMSVFKMNCFESRAFGLFFQSKNCCYFLENMSEPANWPFSISTNNVIYFSFVFRTKCGTFFISMNKLSIINFIGLLNYIYLYNISQKTV